MGLIFNLSSHQNAQEPDGAQQNGFEQPTLTQRTCKPCEGGVEKLSRLQSEDYLKACPAWRLQESGDAIERKWVFKNFVKAIAFFNQVAEVAEAEQHHPDLHLTGYRNVKIVLTTHAIGGLSENDFIVAAKIDELTS